MIDKLNKYCEKVHIAPSDLTNNSYKPPLPLYRAVFSYLMYPLYTQTDIGKILNRKPSSIFAGLQKVKDLLSIKDVKIKRIFEQLNLEINHPPLKRPDFNIISKQIYKANKEKGFHEKHFSDNHFLCLVASELMEAVEAHRINKRAELEKFYYMKDVLASEYEKQYPRIFDMYIKDTVEDELADATIRLLDLMGNRNYNLSNFKFIPNLKKIDFTENVWEVLIELVACEEEEAVFLEIPIKLTPVRRSKLTP